MASPTGAGPAGAGASGAPTAAGMLPSRGKMSPSASSSGRPLSAAAAAGVTGPERPEARRGERSRAGGDAELGDGPDGAPPGTATDTGTWATWGMSRRPPAGVDGTGITDQGRLPVVAGGVGSVGGGAGGSVTVVVGSEGGGSVTVVVVGSVDGGAGGSVTVVVVGSEGGGSVGGGSPAGWQSGAGWPGSAVWPGSPAGWRSPPPHPSAAATAEAKGRVGPAPDPTAPARTAPLKSRAAISR